MSNKLLTVNGCQTFTVTFGIEKGLPARKPIARSSSREGRIRVPFFSVYFRWGPSPKKETVKGPPIAGGPWAGPLRPSAVPSHQPRGLALPRQAAAGHWGGLQPPRQAVLKPGRGQAPPAASRRWRLGWGYPLGMEGEGTPGWSAALTFGGGSGLNIKGIRIISESVYSACFVI